MGHMDHTNRNRRLGLLLILRLVGVIKESGDNMYSLNRCTRTCANTEAFRPRVLLFSGISALTFPGTTVSATSRLSFFVFATHTTFSWETECGWDKFSHLGVRQMLIASQTRTGSWGWFRFSISTRLNTFEPGVFAFFIIPTLPFPGPAFAAASALSFSFTASKTCFWQASLLFLL